MTTGNQALYIHGAYDLRLEDVQIPEPKEGRDRVAVELGLPCRTCHLCKRGKYNLCKPFSMGGLVHYLQHPADFCHKLPDHVSLEEGALIEPLAVGVRACVRGGVTLGSRVLICGAGPIGISSLLAAQGYGAIDIAVTDISESRLELARHLGATRTVLVRSDDASVLAKQIKETLGWQPDCSIDTCGVPSSLHAAVLVTQPGGVVTPVALEPPEVMFPIVTATLKEVDIKGVFSYCNNYPAAIALVASGRVKAREMITHRFEMSQFDEAFRLADNQPAGLMKALIRLNP